MMARDRGAKIWLKGKEGRLDGKCAGSKYSFRSVAGLVVKFRLGIAGEQIARRSSRLDRCVSLKTAGCQE